MKLHTLSLGLFVLFVAITRVCGSEHVETANIALYQPENVLVERKMNPEALGAYIQKLSKIVEGEIDADAKKEALDVVVVVMPGKKSKVWFVSSLGSPPPREPLAKKLEGVVPMEVVGGPLAFAISLNIAGATREGEFKPPMPTEWNSAVEKKGGQVRIPEGSIDIIWDDAASPKKTKAEQGGAH